MKSKLAFLYVLMLLLASCGKGDDPSPVDPDDPSDPDNPTVVVDFLDLSLTTINFTAEKDASLVVVNTNTKWEAACSADWISLSASEGDNSTGFIIGASTNKKFLREATINISGGDKTKEIKIKQSGVSKIEFEINGVAFKLLPVSMDTTIFFIMGNHSTNLYMDSYFISETEITNAQWRAVMGSLPIESETNSTDLPVYENWENITEKFIPKINELIDYNLRLPTETEWEIAAVGGKKDIGGVYAGSIYIDEVAWYWGNSEGKRHNVALKMPNELGLYDMTGNVSEWCSDWYEGWTYLDPAPPAELSNPTGPATGTVKVIRGGDCRTNQDDCSINYRNNLPPNIIETEYTGIKHPGFLYEGYFHFPGFRLVIAKN
ncbi:MAG: SUMF1/EgtB/PvdO family nonheme iron enzyme [Prolixibacteraceae bacterium]|jgi:hypothetical protein|nr:SUMF1/EgtB/PvdO family nonheme iron enzyme [Prolixibacteraceae bacterium]